MSLAPYLSRLFSPENLPNIGLFIAGITGIIVALCTLQNIAKQTRLLVVYTAATRRGVLAATKSAEAAKRSAEIAAESASQNLKEMQLEQRAWVGVTAAKMTNFHPGQQVRAVVWVKNTGKTFAVNTTIYQRIVSLAGPLTRFEDEGTRYPGITLLPGADFAAEVGGGSTPLPVSEFEAIKTGKMFVYMYGTIHYQDVLGSHHCTQFSVIYNPSTDHFDAHQGYNDSD